MSNSKMKGVFNSRPGGYLFSIEAMNEGAGNFTGRFQEREKNVELIGGGFFFDNAKKKTDLAFSTNTDDFTLWADYDNGAPYFESWYFKKVSKANVADVQQGQFYQDLSGEGGSWFGSVDWWGLGHM